MITWFPNPPPSSCSTTVPSAGPRAPTATAGDPGGPLHEHRRRHVLPDTAPDRGAVADAAVLHGRVSDVAEMIALSKRTMANIHQNIAIALGLKVVFLVTTIIGVTGLWPAILADTGATVLVTLNALRLLAPVRKA